MVWKSLWCGIAAVLATLILARPVTAEDPAARQQDEQAIRAAAKAYRAALAKGDSKAVAEFWTADGDFVDDSGNLHPASELADEVAKSAAHAQQPPSKVTASKIRFVSPGVAVEDGTSEVETPDAKPVRGHFHAVWVRQDGRWRLSSLCDMPIASSSDSPLADLGWMVGTWTAESDGARLEVKVQWNSTRTFLLRDVAAIHDGKAVVHGSQRFGWDPLARTLRSWSFDSDGGFGQASWTKDGDAWVGQVVGVLSDGRQSSATTVITYNGKDSFTRKVLAGRIQGEPTPDQEVRYTRRTDPKP